MTRAVFSNSKFEYFDYFLWEVEQIAFLNYSSDENGKLGDISKSNSSVFLLVFLKQYSSFLKLYKDDLNFVKISYSKIERIAMVLLKLLGAVESVNISNDTFIQVII